MSKVGSGKASKGGSSKSKGGKTQEEVVVKSMKMNTPAECRLRLRNALFNEDGTDKNVTSGFEAMLGFKKKNSIELQCAFVPGKKLSKKNPTFLKFAFSLCKEQQEDAYDNSGYGWDDDDKMSELTAKESRYLVMEDQDRRPVAFAHFGFTLQGDVLDQMVGEPVLKVYNIAVLEGLQRQGIGQRLIQLLELIARKNNMAYVQTMVTNGSDAALAFFQRKLKGYKADNVASYCQVELEDLEELASIQVFSKCLDPALIKKVSPIEDSSAAAAVEKEMAGPHQKPDHDQPPEEACMPLAQGDANIDRTAEKTEAQTQETELMANANP